MIFEGIVKDRKIEVRIGLAIAVLFMMFLSLQARQWIYLPILLVVLLACFFYKKHIISEKGVGIERSVFSFTSYDYWSWDEVTTLHTDYDKAKPNVMVHIGKDVVTRTFTFPKKDIPGIVELAEEMNPDIYIVDISKEEQDRMDQKILHKQKVLRRQKAAAKKKKKK